MLIVMKLFWKFVDISSLCVTSSAQMSLLMAN